MSFDANRQGLGARTMLRSLPESARRAITRRRFLASLVASSLGLRGSARALEYPIASPVEPFRLSSPVPDVVSEVVPRTGVITGVAFGDSIQRLIAAGVLDPEKFRALGNELPEWVERLLAEPSDDPILFSHETAPQLVNLLWPIGLSNRTTLNEKSAIFTPRIPNFASTAGWTVGRAPNGYVYFNQVDAVSLTDEQQAMVLEVASTTYRPCCDNPTLFQDCNHGSALLGLLELGASQGATLEGLYGLGLIANSFWFPEYYARIALYLAHFHRVSWSNADPKLVLGSEYSSLSGWQRNVYDRLLRANVRLPGESGSQQACGL